MASKTRYIRATAVGTISPGEGGEKREEGGGGSDSVRA